MSMNIFKRNKLLALAIRPINYVFWWIVVTSLEIVFALCLVLVPRSIVERRVQDLFEDSGIKITTTGMAKKNDDNKTSYDKSKYKCEVLVHNPAFFWRFAKEDFIALGEAYMVRIAL